MTYELIILGLTHIDEQQWEQPCAEIVRIPPGIIQATVYVTITDLDRASGTTTITLQTALENEPARYADGWQLSRGSGDDQVPITRVATLSGAGASNAGCPGAGCYLKVKIAQAAGAAISLDVKAILKP